MEPESTLPAVTGRRDEIEVTPAMIEAGIRALAHFDPGEDPPETWGESVADIYRAMLRAKA
jgi:hypothetical protein